MFLFYGVRGWKFFRRFSCVLFISITVNFFSLLQNTSFALSISSVTFWAIFRMARERERKGCFSSFTSHTSFSPLSTTSRCENQMDGLQYTPIYVCFVPLFCSLKLFLGVSLPHTIHINVYR